MESPWRRSAARRDMRHRQASGAGPGFFFFLSGLTLAIVWVTQQLYL
jgi:hypothetical protein